MIVTISIILLLTACITDSANQAERGDKMGTEKHIHTNKLSSERSPYLLQHAQNPVDWSPWGTEAFQKAETENKLIFLSIGYSTCHWCHVMERESFENEEVANLMNRVFVSIKVDREERPDLDSIYMETAMTMNRRGGWPLNLILTPGGIPFYAATYIPKTQMMKLIPQLEEIWIQRPEDVRTTAQKILQALKDSNSEAPAGLQFEATDSYLDSISLDAFRDLEKRYDDQFGGFNRQPKFPQPHNLLFLLRQYYRTGNTDALDMVENTLQQMREGGIYDQAGFGFHRYSTDREWKLPHFEKMLYDQAILLLAYTEAYQLTGNSDYKQTSEEIIEYVMREMRAPGGGFYSAEDADSEGEEGKFYLWNYDEFINLLDKNGFSGEKYAGIFNLRKDGNYTDEAGGGKPGDNILFRTPDNRFGIISGEAEAVRSLLFDERERRIHPHKDDKILTDWNGLMISALARAAWIFDKEKYYEAAKKAAEFLLSEMKQPGGSLLHSYRRGDKGSLGMIDDYAFLIRALLELYRAGFDISYLKEAALLTEYTRAHFEDKKNGGYYQSDSEQTDLLIRRKELIDKAVPSGNSVMFENLQQLFKITGDPAYRNSAEGILKTLSDELSSYPSAFTMLLSAFDYSSQNGREIIVIGETEDVSQLMREINRQFHPGTIVLMKNPKTAAELEALAAYTTCYRLPAAKKAAVYVCTDFTCRAPVYGIEELRTVLTD